MPTIRVELVDAATGTALGVADLPAEDLPDSFAAATTLQLAGADWHVERAEPVTRDDYVASGQLKLVLRKLVYVDPRKILYSLPTLEDALPPLRDGDAAAAYAMHEDDWRQVELVAARFEPEIA